MEVLSYSHPAPHSVSCYSPRPEEVKIPCKVPYFPALPEETLRFTGFPQPFSPSSHSPVWLNSGAEPL